MSKGLKFLLNKSWHPMTRDNQKKLWIAEQKKKEAERREKERQKELEKERAELANAKLLGRTNELDFMYKSPPGIPPQQQQQPSQDQQPQKSANALKDKQWPQSSPKSSQSKPQIDANSRLTYEEQKLINSLKTPQPTKQELEERFPILKGVPTVGDYTEQIAIRARPLGIEIRNVRCARCGQWGHVSGDRECPMLDQNPNDEFHKQFEDPLYARRLAQLADAQNLVLKSAVKLEQQFGGITNPEMTTILEEPPETAPWETAEDPELAFLSSLTKKQKRKLLRRLEKHEQKQKGIQEQEKESKKRKRKHKHNKHKTEKNSKKRKSHPSTESEENKSASEGEEPNYKKQKTEHMDQQHRTDENFNRKEGEKAKNQTEAPNIPEGDTKTSK